MNYKDDNKPIQDTFLNDLLINKFAVDITLINGLILTGKILKFDNFSLLLEYKKKPTLLYKHSVAFIYQSHFKKNKK